MVVGCNKKTDDRLSVSLRCYMLVELVACLPAAFNLELEVLQRDFYYPFGLSMEGAWIAGSTDDPRMDYRYNGKELSQVTGLMAYGARYYDPAIGRFGGVDPLAEKYPGYSPYTYVYDNPLSYIDPDGKEGIIVAGQPGDHKNQQHFLINGLDRAKSLQTQYNKEGNGEKVTFLVYNNGDPSNGGYSKKTIEAYQKKAKQAGITMKVVSDSDDIVDYVNNKNGSSDSRSDDLVSDIMYFGHATPGDLDIGFEDHGNWNMLTNETLDVTDFKKSAFSKDSDANLVGGCRTGVKGNLPFERSVAEQMADKVGGTVKASNVRVYYPGGVVSDKKLVSKNKGKIITIQGRNN